jgi:dTDP-4-dehydrorhamnose 3,5-epimerase
VQIRPLDVPGVYELTPRLWDDERGTFLEWYRADELAQATGVSFELAQANTSVSQRGVVRGIHFADTPPGQAKHVTVTRGAVIDFIVDIRVGSPSYGSWCSVRLDDVTRKAVYIAEGLGHAFVALEDDTTVSYLVSSVYNPSIERVISPFDPTIALEFPSDLPELIVSDKDREAPTLDDLAQAGVLPLWSELRSFAGSFRGEEA